MVGGTPAFSTTKTGRHDIAEILLKVASNTKKLNQNQINIEKLLHIMKLTFKHIAEFALIKLFFVCLAFRFF